MLHTNASSAPVFQCGLRLGRMMLAGVFILAMVAPARGRATSIPQAGPSTKQRHWRKFVNRQFGFSFWYPDKYRPSDGGDLCKHDEYDECLLFLAGRGNSESIIWVKISVGPFQLYPDSDGDMPRRKLIGRHIFYSKTVGNQGTSFKDVYDLDLKGKDLMFVFGPDNENVLVPSKETKQLEPKILETFRTF